MLFHLFQVIPEVLDSPEKLDHLECRELLEVLEEWGRSDLEVSPDHEVELAPPGVKD